MQFKQLMLQVRGFLGRCAMICVMNIAYAAHAVPTSPTCAVCPTCSPIGTDKIPEGQPVVPKNAPPVVQYQPVSWQALPNWSQDRVSDSWRAVFKSCQTKTPLSQHPRYGVGWQRVCQAASELKLPVAQDMMQLTTQREQHDVQIRQFIEQHLQPHRVVELAADGSPVTEGLLTGYYEPIYRASRVQQAPYLYPIYRTPSDLTQVDVATACPGFRSKKVRARWDAEQGKFLPYYTRGEITARPSAALTQKALAWLTSPIDVLFLQIQGSGKLVLPSGEVMRAGYDNQNGHPYVPVGRWLIQQGLVSKEDISMQKIRQWLEDNPASIDEVLNTNPSYVFFRDDRSLQSDDGARGALGLPLTPARSIAIDATVHPNGAPFYISAPHPQAGQPPIQRLVVAQDTGGAIKGGVRADFYTGSGDAAGELAGVMKQPLQMWIFLPR